MKRLFKLGLSALMGVCSLVGISRAQTLVIDTTESAKTTSSKSACTLQDDGTWKTVNPGFGLKFKVESGEDGTMYNVSFTCKDADNEAVTFEDNTSSLTGLFSSELSDLESGTYSFVFSLIAKADGEESFSAVADASTVEVTVVVAQPTIKLTSSITYTEVDGTVPSQTQGPDQQVKFWVFPSGSAPVFTIDVEDGDVADYIPFGCFVMGVNGSEGFAMFNVPDENDEQMSLSFTFKPEDEAAYADGDYTLNIVDANQDIEANFFIRIGAAVAPVYGFEAVGATTEGEGDNAYKMFPTGEAQFAVIAENAPAGWFAEVSAWTANGDDAFESRIAVSGDSIITFSTLSAGQVYFAQCVIFKVLGTNVGDTVPVKMWLDQDAIPFKVNGEILPTDPTLTVTAGDNGTPGDDDVITFEGAAKFTATLSGLAEDETASDFKIEYKVYTKEDYDNWNLANQVGGGLYEDEEITLTGVYNGEYVIVFALTYVGTVESQVGDDIEIYFNVTGYPEPVVEHPAFSVKTVGNTTNAENEIVFADGKVAFDLFANGLAAGDTTYKFYITIAPEDEFAEADIRLAADSLRFDNTYEYNGKYVATFELWWYNNDRRSDVQVADTTITFLVTEGEARPEMEVKPVDNTTEDGKIIFADGKVAFDVLTKNVTVEAGDDSTYKFNITIAAEGEFPMPDVVDFADSLRYETILDYNGTYEAAFELVRLIRGEYQNVADQKITFYVTEGMERPELEVKPVDNTTEDGKIIFADGKVAFDLFTTNVTVEAGDDTTYRFEVSVWNKADRDLPAPDYRVYADSVRFETELEYNGEYEIAIELQKRNARGGYDYVADEKVTFFVTGLEDRPEVTVKPVDNTTEDGKIIFADGKAAFDVLTKGIKVEAGDDTTYKIYVTIWNTEDDNDFPEPVVLNYADSVRYVAEAAYTNGTYEAAFELMKRDDRGDYTNVADATITFYVTENVAVENNTELAGVNVYPNPSNGTFNVAVPEKARIDIFGLNGAKVMGREVNAGVETFSINHSGIYFVRVMAGNKAAVKRVVVR